LRSGSLRFVTRPEFCWEDMIQVRAFNLLAAPAFQFWAFSGSGSLSGLSGRVIMHKSAKKDKT
jgi:hypothetical protein